MATMYLVTDGCYSDYRVLGVYDSMELAARAKEIFNADNDVEEHELNAVPDVPPGLLAWRVRIQKDGTAVAQRDSAPINADERMVPYSSGSPQGMVTSCYATDEKHAVKIANERRIAALAIGTWEEDWGAWVRKTYPERYRAT